MKILVITTVPFGKDGITNVALSLMRQGMKTGESFDLVTTAIKDEKRAKELEASGVRIFVLPRNMKESFKYVGELSGIIRENGYDAVHIHTNSHTCVYELLAAKRGGCGIRIVHAHNSRTKHPAIHKMMTPLFNSLCNVRLACSEKAGRFMHGKHPFTVINNGVDTKKYSFCETDRERIRKELSVLDNEILLGHVGAFNEQKNQRLLVEIMSALASKPKKYRLVLVGTGALEEQIKKAVQDAGLGDKVIFAGSVDEVYAYLSAMDIILMPSLYEGLPLTLVEQQANGLCCIVSDCITKEADLTGNLTFLPIDQGVEPWVEAVENAHLNYDRYLMSQKADRLIREKGYEIESTGAKMSAVYRGE